MRLLLRRREAAAAESRLRSAHEDWSVQTHSMRARFNRHREWWVVGAGFIGGIASTLLPGRGLARAGRLAGRIASFALRSPFAALLVAGVARPTDTGNKPAPK